MQALTTSPAPPSASAAEPRFDKIYILADDLTGACDSAASFLATGLSVRVWLGPTATQGVAEPVQAFNTASRGLDTAAAAGAVSEAALAISGHPRTLWFKKVDSAGRGQIGAEVLAAHRALGTRAVLFAPSFPAAGRTVREGILHVEDSAGNSTHIPLLIQFQQFAPTILISNVAQVVATIAASNSVLICDAVTQQDLEDFAAIDAPGILYAGSAGLAKALAKTSFTHSAIFSTELPRAARPMTFSGSLHGVTHLQMQHLADRLPSHPAIQIPVEVEDQPAILHHFETFDPDALILTGGDTALLVLQTLGADSILLCGEVADGIPWGLVQGGLAHGRIVVTKSGGFGTAESLTRIVHQLTGEISA